MGVLDSPDVLLDLESESPTLVVAFGGLLGRLGGLGAFEFMRTLPTFDTRCAFVRDAHRLWYHGGVEGVGAGVDAVADELRSLIGGVDAERVVFVGSSAGGYAAILFGSLISVHEVLAFAPQTFLDPSRLAAVGDQRWPELRSRAAPRLNPRYADLRPILEASRDPGRLPVVRVHYATEEKMDTIHAEHIADISGVHLVAHSLGGLTQTGAHNLSKALRDQSLLHTIVAESVFGPAADSPPRHSQP